ncbi:Serine aminopeptidase, S33-type [Desulfonema limicola]|uniref:Serine aminopeptidase, S33-type n=1 Tax=Desulfonema limicola TaxID=45656 RepID=A0A975GHP6_9BACT|nr:alpha/beta fold hydrolase [Desulfonema limicola]QTA81554.1 Serine aminopeptidase, S33-type [Desulfonema limicola]
MNRFAYLTTGLAIKTLSGLTRANIRIHGQENIPQGCIIFAPNHFTRFETLILPGYIYSFTNKTPVWSLADYSLFKGSLKTYLDQVGAVSTKDPDRDLLIVKSLINKSASWIIFPEGLMVKNKKIIEKGRFMISSDSGKHPPHTGAATLALRTEFYRQRMEFLRETNPDEVKRLAVIFGIEDMDNVLKQSTYIVPVNITYYPMRACENILSRIAVNLVDDIQGTRALEEIMTEGTMLLSGVDVDIRFGQAINIKNYLKHPAIVKDMSSTGEIGFDDTLPSGRHMRKSARTIMYQYMTDIYRMTTVNHDHLFASLLKMTPYQKIDPDDLCRRVFLLAEGNLRNTGLFLHKSLEEDQSPLIIDDRYGKFKKFLSIAIEKGIIKFEQGFLEKQKSRMSSIFDFHQIRIDNPVTVMANEIEPLKLLQKSLRRIAWTPGFLIKQKTVNLLYKRTTEEFETDYKAFYNKNESKSKDVGMPYLIKGKTRKIGVLLIHGYMAGPLEMAGLAVYLGRRGISLYVPRLKGHGTTPEDLADRTYKDWISSAENGYGIIRNLCEKVVVGGFSTGAALALDLAARIDKIEGVFAVCPPRRLKDPSLKKNLAKDIWNRLFEMVKGGEIEKKDYIENFPENPYVSYLRNPVEGIREIELFMETLEPRLAHINIPSLIIHSLNDPVAEPESSKQIFEMIGSKNKTYALLDFDRHGILSGQGSNKVHKMIKNFINSLLDN